MRAWLIAILSILPLMFTAAHADDEQDMSGLKVPRFVSLRTGDANMRIGPGTRYPISWVFKREDLPVEITEEFDQWRKVRTPDGTVGWVHKQVLQGKRTAVIIGGIGVLRHAPEERAGAVVRAEAGVIGRLLECERDWCRMQVSGRKGWIEKAHIWGVYSDEEF